MSTENIVRTGELVVETRGVSKKSKEDAVNNAFNNLRSEISKREKSLIIYMKPTAVSVRELKTEEYTERFLFIFMPRKKERVNLTLIVTVEYEALDL